MSTTKQKTTNKKVKLSTLKPNPDNPRLIKDDKFYKLVESIKTFGEKMMPLRPIVIDENKIILGGNMRFKALKELGYKEIPVEWVKSANDLSDDQKKEFIIKDNVGFGDWDFEALGNDWDGEMLSDWGLDIPNWELQDLDYSILDDEDIDNDLEGMENGVKRAIQIEFHIDDYERAKELIKYWREKDAYIGGLFMDFLQKEKNKI